MSNLIAAAVQRRVVGSATRKAVLLYMADKAADDGSGIWTSKANIARDLELSRRAVQMAIAELIRDGLVLEVGQRECKHGYVVEHTIVTGTVDKLVSTREQDSPRESDARVTREPRSHDPVNQVHPNHLKNLTTTPAAETAPVDKSDAQSRCLEAGGPGLCPASREAIVCTADVIHGWLRDGLDLEADVLPTIARRTVQIRISPIRTWSYFTEAVHAARQARLRREADPRITAQHRFYADWINSDRYLPPNAVSNIIARALLGFELVAPARLAERGVPVPDNAGGQR